MHYPRFCIRIRPHCEYIEMIRYFSGPNPKHKREGIKWFTVYIILYKFGFKLQDVYFDLFENENFELYAEHCSLSQAVQNYAVV